MNFNCPGSKIVRQPIPESFTCPSCGGEVEIWTHENVRKCSSCGTPVIKNMDVLSCVQWCQHAKQCVGSEKYDKLLKLGVISKERKEEVRIPERLKEFMRECGVTIPGANA